MHRFKHIYYALFAVIALITCTACKGQTKQGAAVNTTQPPAFTIGDTVAQPGQNIDCILQDKHGRYWLGSNGNGAYCYDGTTLLHLTQKHGLCSNYVLKIQEDNKGNIWFSTREGHCCLSGNVFTNYSDIIPHIPYGKWQYKAGGIFLGHSNGMCFYDGATFTNFTIQPDTYRTEPGNMNRPYGVYSTLAAKDGKVWFGTQEKGACYYNGSTYTYLTEKDLAGPAVRALYEDKNGTIWMGNNGGGLYRYDGQTLRNITEEQGLQNLEFLRNFKPIDKPGSLARPWAINEDKEGNLWVGTIDAGVWKFDGTRWTNYTTQHGLTGNAVWVIYKDHAGELWFVTNGDAICKFNGSGFSRFKFGKG